MLKIPKWSPFNIFQQYVTVQNYHFSITFVNILMFSKGPLNVLIFCNKMDVKKSQNVPLFHFRHYKAVSDFFGLKLGFLNIYPPLMFLNSIRIFDVISELLRSTEEEAEIQKALPFVPARYIRTFDVIIYSAFH